MTSQKTNQEIKKILDKHLSREVQEALFTDLSKVKGNKSFTDSIQNLLSLLKR